MFELYHANIGISYDRCISFLRKERHVDVRNAKKNFSILKRYHPDVQTKGKIHKLAKITPEDCKFIDDKMTKFSRYEHSQPAEAPVKLPEPDEIKADLTEIKNFLENVQKRT